MKKYVLLFAMLTTVTIFPAIAQSDRYVDPLYDMSSRNNSRDPNVPTEELNNFIVSNSGLVWQRVYDIDMSSEQIEDFFKSRGFMKLTQEDKGQLVFEINKLNLNVKKRYSYWITPIIMNYPMSAFVLIQCKDGKYRVTLSNITFTPPFNYQASNTITTNENFKGTLEEVAYNYRRKKWKSTFQSSMSEMLSTVYGDLFSVTDGNVLSDEW